MAVIDRDFFGVDYAAEVASAARNSAHGGQVVGAIVVQSSHSIEETLFLLDQTDAQPLRGVVGWVDATADVPAQLATIAAHPSAAALVGIRHLVHIEADENWLLRPAVESGIREIANAGLAFDLVVRPWQLRVATQLVSRIPEARFVLDHLGKPPIASGDLDAWSTDLAALAANHNVVAKVSGLSIEDDWVSWSADDLRPVLDHALDVFGPSRLMFGGDWPLSELTRGGLSEWFDTYCALTEELTIDEKVELDSRTAERAYRMGE